MELLNQIFAIIFYLLFFSWAFLKISNVILIKKMNYKEIYKNIKKDLKHQKLSKYLFRIIIISIIIFAIYLAIGLAAGALALFMIFITLGGAAYVDTGADSTFYDNLMSFVGNHFSLFKYIVYYMYLIVYILLIRAIYINILSYKKLKSDDILNNVEQNVSKQSNTINTETNTLTKKNSLILLSTFVILIVICICMLASVPSKISNNDGTNGHEPIIVEKLEDIAYDVNPSGEYTVYLEENGIYKPYLVLTNNYNGNCLLLRKHVLNENRIYNQEMEYSAYYEDSDIDTFLNAEYIELFSDTVREHVLDSEIIITAKESLEFSGEDTKSINRKVFLLSCAELGETMFLICVKEGEALVYFDHQRKRIAYDEDGNARNWWVRTPDTTDRNLMFAIIFNGAFGVTGVDTIHGLVKNGVRPAFCMSPDTPVTLTNIEGMDVYVLNIEKDK